MMDIEYPRSPYPTVIAVQTALAKDIQSMLPPSLHTAGLHLKQVSITTVNTEKIHGLSPLDEF